MDISIHRDCQRLLRRRFSRYPRGPELEAAMRRASRIHRHLHRFPGCVVHAVLITIMNGWRTEERCQIEAPCLCSECDGKDSLMHFLGCSHVRRSFPKTVQRATSTIWSTHLHLLSPLPPSSLPTSASFTFLLYSLYCSMKSKRIRLQLLDRQPLGLAAVQRLAAVSRKL